MEFLKSIQEAFAPEKFIDQAEKNTQAVLAYVEPKELSKTLVSFTGDVCTFARAQVEAIESITATMQKQAEDFTNQFAKLTK